MTHSTLSDSDLHSSSEYNIDQVFHHLKIALDSCSEHDVLYDIFVASEDGEAYRLALREIGGYISRITSINISIEELLEILSEADIKSSKDFIGVINRMPNQTPISAFLLIS
ncbi:MAG: hypothetical protein EOM68_28020, partial [Spirochaetia bacterium]|nr:hypothetical protein [Spirochaetia bacterium]